MHKKFITNLGLLLLLNLLIKPFWVFGIDRTVQNVVGAQEFGFYYAVLNFSFLFNILLDLGITNFNNRNIAQNSQLLAKHFSGIVSLKLFLGVVYFIVTVGVSWLWGYRDHQLQLLILVGFNQFLLSFFLYLRSNISGMLMFRTESLMSVLDRSLMIIIMSVLLWGGISNKPFKIEWFIYGQTAAYIIAVSVAYLVVVLKSKSLKIYWSPIFFIMILRKSMPFALLTLMMVFYIRIDSVMIEKILPDVLGDVQVGIYAHAFRILEATNQIAFLFAVFLLPLFSHLIKKKQNLREIISISFSLLFVGTFILAVGSYIYSYQIMDLLYDDYLQKSAEVYSVLIFGVIAMGTSYVFGTLLTANGNLKELNIIAAISVAISLFLNLLLIPEMHATGAAIANLSALSFSTIAQLWVVKKVFKFHPDIAFFRSFFGFVILSIGFAFISKIFFENNWLLGIGLFVISSFVAALILRLLNIKTFIGFVKETEL